MEKRNFWHRVFAYFIDLILFGVVFLLVAGALNNFVSQKIVGPNFIYKVNCQIKDNLVSQQRMDALLPLAENQSHQQKICKQTNVFFISFYVTYLEKIWSEGNKNYSVAIRYTSDEFGEQRRYIHLDSFFYLLAPFVFALFLAKTGQTPGKRYLRLVVCDAAFQKPTLIASLKREYLKSGLFVIPAIMEVFYSLKPDGLDIDAMADLVQAVEFLDPQIIFWSFVAISIFWLLGSFIRWRGATFWDQFAKLKVARK